MGFINKKSAAARQKPFEVLGDMPRAELSEDMKEEVPVSEFEQEELLSEILGQQFRRLNASVGEKRYKLKPRWLYEF